MEAFATTLFLLMVGCTLCHGDLLSVEVHPWGILWKLVMKDQQSKITVFTPRNKICEEIVESTYMLMYVSSTTPSQLLFLSVKTVILDRKRDCLWSFYHEFTEITPTSSASYIKPCSKTSNLRDCIKENIEAIRPHIGNGVPELYLDSLNPWTHPSIKMNIPILRFDIYDVKVWKMDTVIVKDIDVNLDEGIFDVSLNYPYAWGECKYDIDGTLFLFNLDAKGYGNGSITDFDVMLKFRGTPKVVDGKNYIDFKKTSFAWNIKGGATVFFKDIFPGNPILSESFNSVANSRAVDFYHIIQPIIEVIISDWIEKSVNGVFSNYSLNELFAA